MVYYDAPSDTLQDTDTHAHARNDDVSEPMWLNSCVREDGLMTVEHAYALTHGTPCAECGRYGFSAVA